MESSIGFLLALPIIILSAKAAGYISLRLHQPAVLGELLVGLLLGPTLVDLFAREPFAHGHVQETTLYLAELGVIFLMFMAGLETDIAEMRHVGGTALLTGTLGVVVPLLLGAAVALAFGFSLTSAIFVGLILTATSVSISAQTLMELGLLRSREGLTLMAAAVVDDILVILLLSGYVAVAGESSGGVRLSDLIIIAGRMAVYLVGALLIGSLLFTRLARRVSALPISEGLIALVIVVTLIYAWAAETIGGMAAITGSFLAGLLFAGTPLRQNIAKGIHTITYGLLVPIFFVSVGLRANGRALSGEDLLFTLAIVVIAVLGKMIGCGLGARFRGCPNREALRVGIGMVSRGEVGLIVASVGLSSGFIDEGTFAVMVIVILATTLLTPVLLRSACRA